jgi:hypothetical protein
LKRLVDHDPGEPGTELGFAAESVQTCEGPDVGLLKHVFGVRIVPHDAARDAIEAGSVV